VDPVAGAELACCGDRLGSRGDPFFAAVRAATGAGCGYRRLCERMDVPWSRIMTAAPSGARWCRVMVIGEVATMSMTSDPSTRVTVACAGVNSGGAE